MRTVLAVVLVLSGRCCQVSVELDGALHSVDARSNRAALDSFVNATKLLLFGAGENCGGDGTCVGDLLEARAGQVRDECAAAAASYDRQKCASLFTCVAKVDAGGDADGHVAFHAPREPARDANDRDAARCEGERRKCSLDPRPAAARAGRRARRGSTKRVSGGLAVCVGAPAPRIVTTFDATLKHAMIHHFFYGDADDEPIRMHAARVINASAATPGGLLRARRADHAAAPPGARDLGNSVVPGRRPCVHRGGAERRSRVEPPPRVTRHIATGSSATYLCGPRPRKQRMN